MYSQFVVIYLIPLSLKVKKKVVQNKGLLFLLEFAHSVKAKYMLIV